MLSTFAQRMRSGGRQHSIEAKNPMRDVTAQQGTETRASAILPASQRKSPMGRLITLLLLCVLLPLFAIHRIALWVDLWLFPDLNQVIVRKPLFIVGLPRSGTTFFHRLLASGRDTFTAMPLWELLLAPALSEKYIIGFLYRIDQGLRFGKRLGPGESCIHWLMRIAARAMDEVHPTNLCDPEEDYLALFPFDGCFLRVLIWPYDKWTWDLGKFDEKVARNRRKKLLSTYRGIVQRHLRYRGKGLFFLSKNPGYVAWTEGLKEEFPDARFAGLRREPKEAIPSQLSSIVEGMALFGNDVKTPFIVEHFVELLAYYWDKLETMKMLLTPKQYRLIDYAELIRRPKATAEATLKDFGYPQSTEDRRRLLDMLARAKSFRSRHRYSLEQFNLTPAAIDAAFGSANSVGSGSLTTELNSSTSVPSNWTSHGCSNFPEQYETIARASRDS